MLDDLMVRCERYRNELKRFDGLDEAIATLEERIERLLCEMCEHSMALTENRQEFMDSLYLQDPEIKILPLRASP